MHAGRGPGRRARGGFRLCSASYASLAEGRRQAASDGLDASRPERGLTSPTGSRGRHRRYPQGSPLRVAAPDPAVTLLLWLRFEHGFESWKGFLARKEEKPTSRALRVAPSGAAFDATECHCTGLFWPCCTRAWRCKETRRLQASRRRGVRDGVPRGCRYARAACAGPLPRACPMSHSSPRCWQHSVVRPVERP